MGGWDCKTKRQSYIKRRLWKINSGPGKYKSTFAPEATVSATSVNTILYILCIKAHPFSLSLSLVDCFRGMDSLLSEK